MNHLDLYRVLEINDNCVNSDDIKQSYFKLAKIWHPDVNKSPEASARFREIAYAYDILKDEKKRSQYDFDLKLKSKERKHSKGNGSHYTNDMNFDHVHFRDKKKSTSYGSNNFTFWFFRHFEQAIHPKTLFFIIIPVSITTLWVTHTLRTSYRKGELNFLLGYPNPNKKETIDAFFNPRTKQWEAVSNNDPYYNETKLFLLHKKMEKKDVFIKSKVKPGES